jgi:phosphoglycolate phosphatase
VRPALAAVLFDWDGTLVDSAEVSYRSFQQLFDSYGIAFDRDAFARTYSPNWIVTYRALDLPESDWPEADARWVGFYRKELATQLPGVAEALSALRDRGLLLGLVTSGDRGRVTGELQRFGLAGGFAVVVCGQDVQNRKPHPEGLILALGALHVNPGQAAYVGDSPEDVEMARAAGVFSIGIPGGFPNREALAASKPDLLAGSLSEAVEALLR